MNIDIQRGDIALVYRRRPGSAENSVRYWHANMIGTDLRSGGWTSPIEAVQRLLEIVVEDAIEARESRGKPVGEEPTQ